MVLLFPGKWIVRSCNLVGIRAIVPDGRLYSVALGNILGFHDRYGLGTSLALPKGDI
jgi:hypothetical protein